MSRVQLSPSPLGFRILYSLQMDKTLPTYTGYDTKLHSVDLVSVEYTFFAIIPTSTLTLSGGICLGPIDGSNRSIWKLFVLESYTRYHIMMCKKKFLRNYIYKRTAYTIP